MNEEEKERLSNEYYRLQVFFTRASEKLVKEEDLYKYFAFSHCGLYAPYHASIYEIIGQGIGLTQQSSDAYLSRASVRVILPIDLRKINFQRIFEECFGNYGNCKEFVVRVLKNLKILDKDLTVNSVDDLFVKLSEYRIEPDVFREFKKSESGDK